MSADGGPPAWLAQFEGALENSRVPPVRFDASLVPEGLLPYQQEAVQFLLRRGGRGLLGHEMGLGKTPMALAIVAHFISEAPILIVAPTVLLEQWASYEAEQSSTKWFEETVAIEGSLLLQDLRAPLHNALFCAWFNEYSRFGERDQMAISYVLHRIGLTRKGTNASRAFRPIERKYHYLTKPSLRPLTLVVKVGHRSGSRRLQ